MYSKAKPNKERRAMNRIDKIDKGEEPHYLQNYHFL